MRDLPSVWEHWGRQVEFAIRRKLLSGNERYISCERHRVCCPVLERTTKGQNVCGKR
jgi:hypothetical protein